MWAIDGTFFFEQVIWHDRPEDTHAEAFKQGGSVAGLDGHSTKTPRRSQRALTKGAWSTTLQQGGIDLNFCKLPEAIDLDIDGF